MFPTTHAQLSPNPPLSTSTCLILLSSSAQGSSTGQGLLASSCSVWQCRGSKQGWDFWPHPIGCGVFVGLELTVMPYQDQPCREIKVPGRVDIQPCPTWLHGVRGTGSHTELEFSNCLPGRLLFRSQKVCAGLCAHIAERQIYASLQLQFVLYQEGEEVSALPSAGLQTPYPMEDWISLAKCCIPLQFTDPYGKQTVVHSEGT